MLRTALRRALALPVGGGGGGLLLAACGAGGGGLLLAACGGLLPSGLLLVACELSALSIVFTCRNDCTQDGGGP